MNPSTPEPTATPLISVIVLNCNGARWLTRCLDSLRQQTIFDRMEVLVSDNNSADGSDTAAAAYMQDWPNGRVIQNGANLGYCEGNNRGAAQARGEFLLFLNNDTWLEAECLERLLHEVDRVHADAATPLVLNYGDDSFQSIGAAGLDLFGLATARIPLAETGDVFMPEGCSYLIRRELFEQLGRFDSEFFIFSDETDLSWRLWIAGHRAVGVPAARLHHRGAAYVNPAGGDVVAEFRTSDTKRFLANRNGLLMLFKNAQHVLFLLVPAQLLLLAMESVVGLAIVRRWGFVKRAYVDAVLDCWRLRKHVFAERKRVRSFRRRGDWWMLRFLRLRPNRWDELVRTWKSGLPKVDAR